MKKESVLRALFNPYSPFIILILGLLLDMAVQETGNNDIIIKTYNSLLNNKAVILTLFISWFAIASIYSKLENKEREIKHLQGKIEEKKAQLNQSNGIILNKYGDFARFNRKNRFDEVLKGFVDNNDCIVSAQIYRYSSQTIKNNINIRLSYESGYVYEGIEINNILQSYYSIDELYYRKLKNAIATWKKYVIYENEYNYIEKEALQDLTIENLKQLFIKTHSELELIHEENDILDSDFDKYRILDLLVLMLSGNEEITEVGNLLTKPHIEEILNTGKRTGILGSILLEDTYIFKHTGKTSKHGRMYLAIHLEVYSQKYVALCAIAPNDLSEDVDGIANLSQLYDNFMQRMKDTSVSN